MVERETDPPSSQNLSFFKTHPKNYSSSLTSRDETNEQIGTCCVGLRDRMPSQNTLRYRDFYRQTPAQARSRSKLTNLLQVRILKAFVKEAKYLGEVTGTGGSVFGNVVGRRLGDAQCRGFSRTRNDVDWGGSPTRGGSFGAGGCPASGGCSCSRSSART